MLPNEAIAEYVEIYKKLYGVALSKEEASFRANNLVNLYKAVYSDASSGIINNKQDRE